MKAKQFWLVAILMSVFTTAASPGAKLPVAGTMPSLDGADTWLNSPPLRAADLRGKVVLVDFWTYTCINWRRTMPWLRAWAQKYKDQGLVIVGVHTPEFSFERELDNVRRAAKEQRVDYPIAVDSQYAIWNAFDNHYWPALYVIDAQGRIRHRQFGEGDYDQLELVIQQLLTEAGRSGFDRTPVAVDAQGAEVAADWKNLRTPETYVGTARAENRDSWALAGDWTQRKEAAVLKKANGKILFRFHARDLHVVMGPATRGKPVRFRVLIDGQPAGAAHGGDVDEAGRGIVDQPRMYQLIRQPGPVTDRQLEIEFLDSGVEVFSFTFG
jgi:thiol-disulfide isomerase/thioredoxin